MARCFGWILDLRHCDLSSMARGLCLLVRFGCDSDCWIVLCFFYDSLIHHTVSQELIIVRSVQKPRDPLYRDWGSCSLKLGPLPPDVHYLVAQMMTVPAGDLLDYSPISRDCESMTVPDAWEESSIILRCSDAIERKAHDHNLRDRKLCTWIWQHGFAQELHIVLLVQSSRSRNLVSRSIVE